MITNIMISNITIPNIIALVLFLFPLAYSPGPGNIFFAANGARFGFRATLPANAGYHIATLIVTAIIGLVFAGAITYAPNVFTAIGILGALYVIYLGFKLARSGAMTQFHAAKPARFVDGVILLVLNPKAYVIIGLMFTQFLVPTAGHAIIPVLGITIIFTVNNFIAFSIWTLAGDALGRQFRDERNARRLNVVFGLVLMGVGIWMLQS